MKHSLIIFTVLMLFGVLAFGQNRTITGAVKDNNGDPVSGASIIIKGTNSGVAANALGQFTISAKTGDVLEISSTDYITTSLKLENQSNISIVLNPGLNVMETVIVTALGIQREKRSLTYATETINADEINKSGTGNPLSELSGKASGLTVINSSGDPGSGTYIRLRGVTSITGDNQPLMVIDGIPVDNSINSYDPTSATPNTSGANSNQTGGTIAGNRGIDINPNDIESITVLKGPAATALYGIKAASGALIITTKKGSLGAQKTSINFNSSTTIDHTNKLPELQSQFSQGTGIDPSTGDFLPVPIWIGADGRTGDGTVPRYLCNSVGGERRLTWGPVIDTLFWTGVPSVWDQNGRIVGASSPLKKIPVSPYDQYQFFQNGLTTNNNLSLTGGSAKNSYRLSVGNLYQKGVVPLAKYNKSTFGVSGQAKLTDRLTVSGSMDYIVSASDKVQQGSNVSGVMLGLLRTPPTFDNSNGLSDAANKIGSYVVPGTETQRDFRGGNGYDNPYWTVNRNPFRGDINRVYGYAAATYELFDWLTLNYRLGGDSYSQDDKNFYDIHSNAFRAGKGIINEYFNNQYNSDFTINLHKDFNKLSATVILGQNYFYNKSKGRTTIGDGLISPTFFDMTNFLSYTALETNGEKRSLAFYGDATLNYEGILFLNVTGRRETSSSLPEANRNFFYPSAGLSWVFSEMPGLKDRKTLSYGKLRLSFAQVGKDAPIQGLQTYYKATAINDGFTTGVFFPITFNGIPTGAYQNTSTISTIGNPDLKPEKTQSYEAGLDVGVLNSRISLTATYYYSKTTDAIFTVPYAYSTGFSSKLQNAGELTNKGLELSLNTTPVKSKDFRWDLNLNWSYNRNMVTKLYLGVDKVLIGGFQNSEIDAFAGKPFGQIYGSVFVRANTNDSTNKTSTEGALLINDNAPVGSGFGQPIASAANAIIGDINPQWQGSVINNLTYKGVSIGFQIDVRQGGDIWNGTRGALSYFGTSKESADRGTSTVFQGLLGHLDDQGNVVHFDNNGNTVAGPGAANTTASVKNQYYWQNIGNSFIGPSEPSVEDGSYIKLRQVSLTYALPKKVLGKTFNVASLTLFANNIILQTKYKGVDPETSLGGAANFQGIDYFNNPGIRSIGFRLNLGL
ncbi:MAG: SusC/RagA family TonB-linked outer membrane protein [Ginsengibacter sp.]